MVAKICKYAKYAAIYDALIGTGTGLPNRFTNTKIKILCKKNNTLE